METSKGAYRLFVAEQAQSWATQSQLKSAPEDSIYSIHMRPPKTESHLMRGHWKDDLITRIDTRCVVVTLVERTMRLVILAKVDVTTASAAAVGFTDKLNEIP